jgi:hypothetical protein
MIKLLSTAKAATGQSPQSADTYKIPVKWQMGAIVTVRASSLQKAVKIANYRQHVLPKMATNHNSTYIADSFEVDYDILEV